MRAGGWPKACEKAREKAAADEKPVRPAMSAIGSARVEHEAAGRVQPEAQIIGARRLADGAGKRLLQCPCGHAGSPRDGRYRQGPVDMRFHQADGAGKPRVEAVEPAERDERLRVGGGARLVVDEDAGDIERHRHAEACAHQMQHQVEGRRGAAGGEHRPVDDIAVGADVGAGKGGGEILQILPVRRRGAPLEQAGARRAARCRPRCRRRRGVARAARRKPATRAAVS